MKTFEVMVRYEVEAEDDETAKLLIEEVLPHVGYSSEDAEIIDVMLTGEPIEI
jgi:hypothetical protein